MTIFRDPASMRFDNVRSIAIPGMAPIMRPYGMRGEIGDFFTTHKMTLLAAGGGLLAGLGIGFFLWKKKR